MVVCKFFLEGYCKFGSRCRFEHSNYYDYNSIHTSNVSYSSPLSGSYSNDGRSVLRSDAKINQNIAPRNNPNEDMQSQAVKSSLNDVVQVASRDTLQLEKGNQWPLTCYAPVKEYGNLPGWDDHSPEEIRWESYNAFKNGTFSTCKQAIDNLYKIAQERRMDMKSKDKATSIIDNQIQIGPAKLEAGNLLWTSQNNSSVFTNVQPSPSASTPTFGAVESFSSNQSNFGNTGSYFGPASPAFVPSSTFGNTLPSSVFASTQPVPAPVFIPTIPTELTFTPLSPVVSDATASVFSTQSNVVPQTTPFVFSLENQVKSSESVSTQNSFLTSQPKQKDLRDPDESLPYSAINTLTPVELNAFESQTFTFGCIPLKPPPKHLCGL